VRQIPRSTTAGGNRLQPYEGSVRAHRREGAVEIGPTSPAIAEQEIQPAVRGLPVHVDAGGWRRWWRDKRRRRRGSGRCCGRR